MKMYFLFLFILDSFLSTFTFNLLICVFSCDKIVSQQLNMTRGLKKKCFEYEFPVTF